MQSLGTLGDLLCFILHRMTETRELARHGVKPLDNADVYVRAPTELKDINNNNNNPQHLSWIYMNPGELQALS